jgi:hypothetical protein
MQVLKPPKVIKKFWKKTGRCVKKVVLYPLKIAMK